MSKINRGEILKFGTYLLTDGLNKALPFLILPVFAYFIDPDEFGLMTNFNVLLQFALPLVSLGTFTYLTVEYFNFDKNKVSVLYTSLLVLIFILFLLSIIIVVIFQDLIFCLIALEFKWQFCAICCAFFIACVNLFLSYLRVIGKSVFFGTLQICQSLILAIVSIFLVAFLRVGWEAKVIGTLISSLVVCIISTIYCFHNKILYFHDSRLYQIKNAVNFGLPLLPHNISFWLRSGVDKIVVTHLLGLAMNGIYSIALSFGTVVMLFTTSFFNVYSPYIYKQLSDVEKGVVDKNVIFKQHLKYILIFAFTLMVLVFLLYCLLYLLVPLIFKGDYVNSLKYIPLVFLTVYFNSLYSMFSIYVFYKKKTKELGLITFGSTILQVVMIYFGCSLFGVIGVLVSSVIISILIFIFTAMLANKYYSFVSFRSSVK